MARLITWWLLTLFLSLAEAALGLAPVENVWTFLAVDPKGDGKEASSADLAQLSYRYDKPADMLWLRLMVFDSRQVNELTVTITLCDAAGAPQKRLVIAPRDPRRSDGHAIVVGFKRLDVTSAMTMNLIAAVGTGQASNDEIPNSRSIAVDLSVPRPVRGLRELDFDRNNLRFSGGQSTLSDDASPRIIEKGGGSTPLILVPGVYSGDTVFDGFIERHGAEYTYYVVIPPGLGGTKPRPLTAEGTSYGAFTWTRRLERDLRELIVRKGLHKPIVMTHGFPGSLAAEALALSQPELIGGIVEIASMPAQPMPSMRNPGRELTPDERIASIDESWVPLWFKYVTPETWESNNYQAEMLLNDPARAERTRRQIETVPLSIKIQYLVENMAWDRRADLAELSVPVLALRPGFNDTLLALPAFGWFKASLRDAWDPLATIPRIQVVTIPDARALILDDQPTLADRAIAAFVRSARH